jgi:hypothetical protein
MLAFGFRRSRRSPHRVVKTPQLAARAGIQIAHTAHHDVGLVIQVQAVANQLIEINLRWAFRAPVTPGPPITPFSTSIAGTATTISPTLGTSSPIATAFPTTARWTILATAICLFFSHVSLRSYSF